MANESSEEEVSHTPRRSKRRHRRSSSSRSRRSSSKRHKSGLSSDDLTKIISALQGGSSKSTSSSNNVVPEFDPDNKAQDVDRWIRKVNECADIYGWDDKQTVHYMLQKLRGLAKSWYESLPTLSYSWEVWQLKLRKAFYSDVNYGMLLEEMLNRKSRIGESLRDYFYNKLSFISRCEIVGRKAVDCIIHGITDSSIRNGAQALKCEEPEDLLSYLTSQMPEEPKEPPKAHSFTNQVKRREFRNNASNKNNTGTRSTDIVCYNCNERGHVFQNCSKAIVKCGKCHRVGHNSDSCVKKPLQMRDVDSRGSQSVDKRVLKVVTSEGPVLTPLKTAVTVDCLQNDETPTVHHKPDDVNAKYNKKVYVNGAKLDAYIDFGSECSLIRISNAKGLCLLEHTNQPLPTIRGFGNSYVTPKFRSSVQIRIDEIDTELEVLAVDDAYLLEPLLIGQNFTEMPSVTVLKDKEKLFFYHTPADDTYKFDRTLNLYVDKDVTITKGGLVEVYTTEAYTGNVYSDGGTRMGPNQEYHLHQGCYDVRDSKAVIFITSFTHAPVTFKANSLIARVSPVDEVKTLVVHTDPSTVGLAPLNRDEIRIGDAIDRNDREKLYELLQKYRDCFATNLNELGCAKDTVMNIDLSDKTPVVYRPYRLSHHERQKVRDMVDDLMTNDIIQESNSNYASPILVVKKKNGESRLCVDYRALNSKTVKDKYPLPLIDDQLSNLSGNKYFITLDLASGYYQVPMGEESRHLTAFVTPDGHYEFKRMPFGLANAPAIFQRMMNQLLGTRRFKSAFAYMDDLLIPSATINEGFERLEEVLQLIQGAGLTLKLSKCSFFDTRIEYLGYEVTSQGVRPSERKISAVKNFPVPRNIHEVRQFLGLASYFRRFVKGFGEIARPLTALLKKDVKWRWSDDEGKAFETLKQCLIDRPLLALYNPELETEVHTDASSLGLGGILMQWQPNPRVLKPVAYFSRQTTPEERHFHSYELETLAVVCSLKRFRPYLLGLEFTVFTDCNALRTTLTKRDLIPRIARWWLLISEYHFKIEYRPGCRMSHVDALSRNPQKQSEQSEPVRVSNITTDNWVLTLQMADPELQRIFKILKPGLDEEVTDIKKHYVIHNHSLHRKVDDGLRLVVPKDARWQICKANHDDVGHFGFAKTLERVQSRYWFPKLRRFIKKYVAACINCAYNKDNAARTRSGFLHPIEKIDQMFHTLHLDHLGPFVRSKSGNNYILTIVDGFTKYVFARPVKDTKTKSVIKALDSVFHDFGIPQRIISDRGTAFTSAQFKDFCVGKGIKHVLNAVACPRANGQAERFNQTILTALSTQNFKDDERNWDKQLGAVQWGINNTINATTKKSAAELVFGVKLNGPIDNKLTFDTDVRNDPTVVSPSRSTDGGSPTYPPTNSMNSDADGNAPDIPLTPESPDCDDVVRQSTSELTKLDTDFDKIRNEASANIKDNQKRQKQLYDSKRSPAISYVTGDLVKITKTNFNNHGKSKKLLPKFIGPYKVTKCLGNDRYVITNVPGITSKKFESVVASDRMRHWINVQALEVNRSSGSESSASDSDSNDSK